MSLDAGATGCASELRGRDGTGRASGTGSCIFANLFLWPLLCGCAAYQVGSETLYAPDVQTVYVPIIESNSFRRDLGERLTEAVIKDIELKTPYKVVGTPNADSVLSARLVSDQRNVLVENAFDTPRVMETMLHVEVTWINRRRLPIAPVQIVPLPPELVGMESSSALIGEVGQSVASAQNQAIERLAEQIVGTMEEPW
ncbi:MAG: LPS assembly lipoprotein LptE [Pirellulales bacterium]